MNPQQQLLSLIKQKDQLQKQLANLTTQIQLIDSTKNYSQGVIDNEGFPRNDLDFGQLSNYRNLKRKKAQLNNDHVKLMKQIEIRLFQYHKTLPKVEEVEKEVVNQNSFLKNKQDVNKKEQIKKQKIQQQEPKQQKYVIQYLTPFAKITLVEQNSPAYTAGIRLNDLLSQFSQINIYTPDNIKQIPYHVKQNVQLKIVVMRKIINQQQKQKYQKIFMLKDKNQYAKVELKVVPQKWQGRGLLGCKIDPI